MRCAGRARQHRRFESAQLPNVELRPPVLFRHVRHSSAVARQGQRVGALTRSERLIGRQLNGRLCHHRRGRVRRAKPPHRCGAELDQQEHTDCPGRIRPTAAGARTGFGRGDGGTGFFELDARVADVA